MFKDTAILCSPCALLAHFLNPLSSFQVPMFFVLRRVSPFLRACPTAAPALSTRRGLAALLPFAPVQHYAWAPSKKVRPSQRSESRFDCRPFAVETPFEKETRISGECPPVCVCACGCMLTDSSLLVPLWLADVQIRGGCRTNVN